MHIQEGIDISNDQGNINWSHPQLNPSDSGKQFIIAKATEGATYQDPRFVANWHNMSAQGFRTGAYHFVRFGTSMAEAQMDNFLTQLQKVGGRSADSIIALDVEEQEGTPLEAYKLVRSVTEACVTYLIEQGIMPYADKGSVPGIEGNVDLSKM